MSTGHIRQAGAYAATIGPWWMPYKPTLLLTGGVPRNLIRGTSTSVTYGNDAVTRGGAFEFPGVSGYVNIGSAEFFVSKNYYTVVMDVVCDALPDQYGLLFSLGHTEGRTTAFLSNNTPTYRDVNFGDAGSATNTGFTLPVSVTGQRLRLVLRKSGTGQSNHDAWCNGIKLTQQSTGSFGSPTGDSVIGNSSTSATTQELDGRVGFFAILDGLLPDSACAILSDNPSRLLSRQYARRVWAPGASGTTNATITAAALAFSAQTLTGSSVAATTPAAAALAFTASAITGGSTAAAAIDAAALTFAGSDLVGSDADNSSAIDAAALTFTGQSLGGTSTAASAIDAAALAFSGADMADSGAATERRGGAYRNRFVEGRKRIALQRLLSYLTEDEPAAEAKRQVRAVKAGKPIPEDERKPPVVMQEVSAEKIAAKLIPERVRAIEQAASAGLDVQRVILKAIELARERDEEEVMLLL